MLRRILLNKVSNIDKLLKLSRQSNGKAQNKLGELYINNGEYDKALSWLQLSAIQGNKNAKHNLIMLQENGYCRKQYRNLFDVLN